MRGCFFCNGLVITEYYKIGGVFMNYNMPESMYLGFAYVPNQKFEDIYDTKEALSNGTIFKSLNIPFEAYKNDPIMNPFK